jgi:GMP synthase-like glutamine amidotransferase
MANLVIVDNGTLHLEELQSICAPHGEITTIVCTELDKAAIPAEAIVVLSGGPIDIMDKPERYIAEIELIKTHPGPVIGICLGFEMIAHTFGTNLLRLPAYSKGTLRIVMNQTVPILSCQAQDTFVAYQSHGWSVPDLPAEFEILARSDTGIEIARHTEREMWGFQFHPEVRARHNTTAYKLFDSLLTVMA